MRRRGSRSGGRWIAVALLVLVAALFSFLNAGERVTLDVGFTTFYRISLVGLVFGAFLLGMVTMFLFGLRYDRRVRDVLRNQPFRNQPRRSPPARDLFDPPRTSPPPE